MEQKIKYSKWRSYWNSVEGPIILLAVLTFVLTFFVMGPLELYFSNRNEFWFNLSAIITTLLVVATIAFLIFLLLGIVARGILKKLYVALLLGIGIGLYAQGNFLNSAIRQLDGQVVNWLEDIPGVAINCILWVIFVLLPIVIVFRFQKIAHTFFLIVFIMLTVMQGASVISLALTSQHIPSEKLQLLKEGEFSLADKNNIIVFVLDTLDTRYFEDIIQQDSTYQDLLKDFTYYNNAVAGGGSTIYGIPMLLTGSYYKGQPYQDYLKQAYEQTEFYEKLDREGYDIRLFITDEFICDEFFSQYIDNAYAGEVGISSKIGLLLKFYQFAGYKYLPNILKNFCYFYSDEFNKYRTVDIATDVDADVYKIDDATFIEHFRSSGLQEIDARGAFRFYHLFGAHGPYTLERDGTTEGKDTSLKEQLSAVMDMVMEYVEQLKKKGLYEDSTIVITGDHGAYDVYQNPCVLIKERGDVGSALTVKNTPITFQNILPTLSMAVDNVNGERNATIHEVSEDITVRYQVVCEALVKQFYGGGDWDTPILFSITGSARERENLKMLGPVEVEKDTGKYILGTEIDFTADGESDQFIFSGISSHHERNGTWLVDNSAELRMIFDKIPENDLQLQIILESVFMGRQHVALFFNDVCIFNQIQEGEIIDCVIPRNAIEDGEQTLRFEVTTTRPSDVSDNQDSRALSLKLQSLSLSEISKNTMSFSPTKKNEYILGTEIFFTKDQNGAQYFTGGVSETETDFVWSLGKSSQIMIATEQTGLPLEGELHLNSIFGSVQRIYISSQGQMLYSGEVNAGIPIIFEIPADHCRDGYVFINIEYPDAVSPASLGVSQDNRILAVAYSSMIFRLAST